MLFLEKLDMDEKLFLMDDAFFQEIGDDSKIFFEGHASFRKNRVE